jgi:hypothetical protein
MPLLNDLELFSCDDRITLAIGALKCDALLSEQHVAALYRVPQSTLKA